MRRFLTPLVLLVSAAALSAQSCPNSAIGISYGGGDDVMVNSNAPIAIGFPFLFAGTTYTHVHPCTNGYFFLSNAGVPAPGGADYTATQAELSSGSPRICPLWTDLNLTAANGGAIHVNATASECTITWRNAIPYGSTTITPFDIQARLFPSGEVRFYYESGVVNAATLGLGYVAIAGASPGLGAALPAPVDLSAGGTTPNVSIFEEWGTAGTFDLANNSISLLPTFPGYVFIANGAPANCASISAFGSGCGNDVADSIYELMPSGTFDLNGRTLSLLRQPTGYLVLDALPGTLMTPTAAAVAVATGDDSEQAVALSVPMPVPGGVTSSINVCSNGRIALSAAGNGTAFTPAVATFLNFANTVVCAAWHDYNPAAGGGQVKFEEAAGIAYVTWDNVYNYGTTTGDTFQIQLNLGTGDITIVYQNVSNVGTTGYLVGYSRGGPSSDPGPLDLSTALASPVGISDIAEPLALAAGNSPALGNPAFTLNVRNVPPLLPIAFVGFGDLAFDPGVDLTPIGMPGCLGHTNLSLGLYGTAPTVAGVGAVALSIPNNPALAGATLVTQGVAFSLETPLNLISSNGLTITLGY